MIKLKNKSAETLIEIMIALAILSLVLISTMRVVANSKQILSSAKNREQAISLAREWLELVRYTRDYNWMNYKSKRRICWNFFADNSDDTWIVEPATGDDDCLDTWDWYAHHLLYGPYIPLHNLNSPDYSWKFFLTTFGLTDLDDTWKLKDNWAIYTDLEIFSLCQDWTWGLIISCKNPWLIAADLVKLKFFRKINIEYIDIDWTIVNFQNPINKKEANHMRVKSTVIWPEWSKVQWVDLVTIYSDYLWTTQRTE